MSRNKMNKAEVDGKYLRNVETMQSLKWFFYCSHFDDVKNSIGQMNAWKNCHMLPNLLLPSCKILSVSQEHAIGSGTTAKTVLREDEKWIENYQITSCFRAKCGEQKKCLWTRLNATQTSTCDT